jgi:deazaflavin-dependent oxidoreductase (nitroreductase family)
MSTFELNSFRDERVLYLTTTGRKSGQPRTIEIWFVISQQRIYLVAELGLQAHWVRNILANPQVLIEIKATRLLARARILNREQDQGEWLAVENHSIQKYGWGKGLPVAIELTPAEEMLRLKGTGHQKGC